MDTLEGISAIIPTWNRADLVSEILDNLQQQTMPPSQVIVVDNGSTDNSAAVAKEHGAELLLLAENKGFAVAVNEGIALARGEWILILNNDVTLKPDWLETLFTSVREAKALFGAGKLLNYNDASVVDGSWDLVSRGAYAWRCGYGRPDSAMWSTRREIAFAPMTAALFHKTVFERVGLLETRFESYYEDVDFGVRCALEGCRGIYEPAAVARHRGKATLGKSNYRVMYLTARNQVFLLAKHYPGRTLRRFAWAILVGQVLAIVASAKHGHLWAAIRGKWDGVRQWRTFRSGSKSTRIRNQELTEALFVESERLIKSLQQQIGFDPYWRLYFSLTGGL